MLRTDREVTDRQEILEILKKCDTLTLAFADTDGPYAVPVSFGFADEDGVLTIYYHGSARGKKAELAQGCPNVCVEGHVFYRAEPTQTGITTRYESVIGFGRVEKLEPPEERIQALRRITAHYGYGAFPVEKCASLEKTAVYRIVIRRISGKKNVRTDEN